MLCVPRLEFCSYPDPLTEVCLSHRTRRLLQLGHFSSWMQCFKKLVRVEGVRSLYYSFPTTLFMNLPYGGVMVATNETLKSYFNPSGGQNAPAFFTRFVLMNARSFL